MPNRNGSGSRSTSDAEDRLSVLTTLELGLRVRNSAHRANVTVSDLVNWCLEHALDAFDRAHPAPRIVKMRPGRKPRLTP